MKRTSLIHGALILGLTFGCMGAMMTATNVAPTIRVAAATEDDTSVRSITLHKYTSSTTPSTSPATGTTADAANVPSDSKPLQGIQFKVERIQKVSGKKLAASDASTYTLDDSFNAITTTTTAQGAATAKVGTGKAADGYYLITELASKLVATTSDPFIVHLPQTTKNASTGDNDLVYVVNVYPKNDLDEDAVALKPQKTVQDVDGKDALATSVMTGNYVLWNLSVTRPTDIKATADDGTVTYASQIVLADPLITANLSYLGYDKPYFLAPDGTKTDVPVEWMTHSGDAVGNLPSDGAYQVARFELNAAGIEKFADQPAGTKFIIPVATTVTADVNGMVQNTFDSYYKGTATGALVHEHSGVDEPLATGSSDTTKPTLPSSADTSAPVVYTGNVDVDKTDEDGHALANAVFTLYPTAADAKAGTNPVEDGNKKVLTAKSNVSGRAEFIGLQVDPASQQQTYYLAETDAPAGYDLNGKVFSVTAKRDTTVDATVVDHDNLWPNLPLTGTNERLLLYAAAGVLIVIGAAGVVLLKRKHA
ncbi:SpaH/EbpB family LPXTG-anchored major pilin [Lacticaseibacillus songhuajiangensis]|uniref:SpaH/EbpB family LPXTG-anchored major pilin n=1 Tax=Lacticaseibacillus songhuajiangensis TaxID=1296539 RepID=UPI000F785A94|nr:SpaH/EbpB family LPXTG-anchored major pilin [Lacticaseibacillus songhuajiangensis]